MRWEQDEVQQRDLLDPKLRSEINLRLGVLTIVSLAVILFISSHYPDPLFLPMLAGLLTMSAAGTAMVAAIVGQPLFAPVFTFWDKAAALMLIGLLAGLFADHEAALAFIEATSQDAAPGGASGAMSGVGGSAASVGPGA